MKNLAISIIILDCLLIIALFLSLSAYLYSLVILLEIILTVGLAIFCIKTHRVSEKMYTIQKYIVIGFTMIEFVGIVSLCAFALATTSRAGTILQIVL